MSIPVFRPTLRRRDFNSVLNCLVSDAIGAGPLSHELAAELARYLGVAGGLCAATYLAAIQWALDCLDLVPGDSVIVPALAPAAYASALASRGLRMMSADVDPASGILLASEVERLRPGGPKALVLCYALGFLPETDELFRLGLPVLEDISQALGASLGESRCGSLGQVCVLNLSPEGIITAGGGAGVFARDRRSLKSLRDAAERSPRDSRLPDLNAALGLAQLRAIESFLRARLAIVEPFTQAVGRSRHGTIHPQREEGFVPFSFPVLVKEGLKQVRQYALRKGVETHLAFLDSLLAVEQLEAVLPAPAEDGGRQEAPAAEAGRAWGAPDRSTPQARDLAERCLLFPLYPTLLKRDAQLIARVLASLP
jgi:dTDP-4-amino-4,6-dideoxygalactose transaminase